MKKISKRAFLKTGMLAMGSLMLPQSFAWSIGSTKKWRWRMETSYYIKTARGVKCLICPNECIIKEGESGLCRSRINENGKLISIAYGNPCAVHSDPIEKKPLYHFLPATDSFSIATAGCNLACLNCQNWQISQASPKETRNIELWPDDVVQAALSKQCKSIAYTYSEPITFYEYTRDTSIAAHKKGLKNVFVSAGYINEKPLRELAQHLDAANIDLKSFSDETYASLNAGALEPVLNTLKILKEEKVWLEITNLIVPGYTDDLSMIREMCQWLVKNGFQQTPLHFSRFQPMYKLNRLAPTPRKVLFDAYETAKEEGLDYVYLGNLPGNDYQHTYCHKCGELVIERTGYFTINHLTDAGHCPKCRNQLPGLWK